jgi:hypothetical protein
LWDGRSVKVIMLTNEELAILLGYEVKKGCENTKQSVIETQAARIRELEEKLFRVQASEALVRQELKDVNEVGKDALWKHGCHVSAGPNGAAYAIGALESKIKGLEAEVGHAFALLRSLEGDFSRKCEEVQSLQDLLYAAQDAIRISHNKILKDKLLELWKTL